MNCFKALIALISSYCRAKIKRSQIIVGRKVEYRASSIEHFKELYSIIAYEMSDE
jgi:hypothetical protein